MPSNDCAGLHTGLGPHIGQRAEQRKPFTLPRLREMHTRREAIAMLTAYDATFAAVADAAGVDAILVGDSLGMVCQGHPSTVPVRMDAMCYHVECVARGLARTSGTAMVIADLPYGSYHESPSQALRNAVALMQAGAHMVKLEGGGWTTDTVRCLTERGIPVCAHLGLTPQSVHALGGYRVQGNTADDASRLRTHAVALQEAGAAMLVLEMVRAQVAADITAALAHCPTIGIGSGRGTAGQVLVLHDVLGVGLGRTPRFVRNFLAEGGGIEAALRSYVCAVKDGSFPDDSLHAW
ncbi:3-methyl-2-oxobutanoate hydroxymethyltransferase [Candidatus Symbiobacter mobilis]|uniref:3-methyl-2-oxobutanoate hydroxymethyltransferase n=1 Tax=Candidatus Symbiobacter mobilis CR TaxID=946483 RepID=U5N9B5_9BURK|nr:3-methyl-2-oxobutanoate hydroxymethyltransferase [Candidatus Symbiobacter mobilis]AGX87992.1 3-methyl-2-oxobutanoate hydroxymethyltransferase [Candidatus Symbiobacter mobilis CR]